MSKKIKSIKVIKPGSNPDVDSDFHTKIRSEVVKYLQDQYGEDSVSSIGTFLKLAAKGAFKRACTIYEIPFKDANRIAALVPKPLEGKEVTLEEMFDPEHSRYNEGAEFREAVATSQWEPIMKSAFNLSGKNVGSSVHACGIIISSTPLDESIPLHVDQKTGRVVTQWTYQECEQLGLIKMDLLGLDTVDILQRTVEYTIKAGKTPPNLTELVQGEMDDPKTYEIFQKAKTSGIFQFGSDMVKQLLFSMLPTNFDDLAATTAVARPGPMAFNTHNEYADRKNGRSEIEPIHDDFKGSPVDEILQETYGLIVYQEQVMHIANQIAGMTFQQADDLRSAMGKKKKAIMDKMKPIFFEGALKNGYSQEAVTILWDTCAAFAEYAFNKSHSVAYAMNAYSSAYLKANYPVEFMASLIAQNVGDKKKTLEFLKEAKSMNLKVGTVDINLSEILVAPDFKGKSGNDILFGIGGIKSVSEHIAGIIVKERSENGDYTSVQDLIDRCTPLGVASRTIYENLAYAGAFDSFGISRKVVIELISSLIGDAKTKEAKGESLFDIFEDEIEDVSIDLTGEDFPFVKRLQHEANVVGLYLTDHPLRKISEELSGSASKPISKLLSSPRITTMNLMASITKVEIKKFGKGGKIVLVDLDDGHDYITARLSPELVKGLDKSLAQDSIRDNYRKGETEIENDLLKRATNKEVKLVPSIEQNSIYNLTISFRPERNGMPYVARVDAIKHIQTTHEGNMPIRIRFINTGENVDNLKKLHRSLAKNLDVKIPGDNRIFITELQELYEHDDNEYLYIEAAKTMVQENKFTGKLEDSFREEGNRKKKAKPKGDVRTWPPAIEDIAQFKNIATTKESQIEALDNLEYYDSGCRTQKSIRVQQVIEKFLGDRNYDFGIFNHNLLDE